MEKQHDTVLNTVENFNTLVPIVNIHIENMQ